MQTVRFADLVHPTLAFSPDRPSHRMVLRLIDTPWFQRLRDISQTANTRLVYMFSEHSRFGHSLGVAYLADVILGKLSLEQPEEVEPHRVAITAAALLHDVGHLAPGSHTAFKSWFPGAPDAHEALGIQVIAKDPKISSILEETSPGLVEAVCAVLSESPTLPPWAWELLSGGGWNVDRGNWCIADSILAGVSYGHYSIPALTESLTITQDRRLALRENRLDAMMHFAVSRQAMYRQIYQHRVLLGADTLNGAIIRRARDVGPSSLEFCDEAMRGALEANSPSDLTLDGVFQMREGWWRYHLMRWTMGSDKVLADLSGRLLERRLFKTVRLQPNDDEGELTRGAENALRELGLDPRYYLHTISTVDVQAADREGSILVCRDDGVVVPFADADPLFEALGRTATKRWLVVPQEAKDRLGRAR